LIQDLDDYILTRQDEDMMSTAFYQPHLVRVGDMTYNKCHCPSIQRFGPSLVEADKEHSFIVSLFEWFQKYEISEDDLTRAFVIANEAKSDSNSLNSTSVKSLQSHFKTLPRHLSGVRGLLEWLLFSRPRAVIPLLNALERIADDTHKTPLKFERGSWRSEEVSWRTAPLFECLAKQLPSALERSTEPISKEEWRRIFALYKYIDEPGGLESRLKANDHFERSKGDLSSDFAWMSFDDAVRMRLKLYPREPIPIQVLMGAFEAGVCSEVDLYDQLIFHVAAATSGEQKTGPVTQSAILKFVDHVIAIESGRGDAPAPTTPVVKQVYGLVSLNSIKLLLSKSTDLSRATAFRESGKEQCFAVLLRNATPPTSDNRADYVKELRALKLKPKLLLQLGMLAPQLGNVIEEILQMDGLEDAIWWMHAHTKDNEWDTSKLLRSFWNGNISERTALTPGDLEIGSCDSVWYHTVREKISDSQWKDLDKYAKFASTGTGHARAQLFAKALSGLVSLEELLVRVADKRNLNSLRAIGLVPLGADREADLRQRYMVLQDFLVSSRQFGSARQESEKLATEVALTNLAITAGYRDRLRLIWAMEANEVRDIQLGGAKVVVDSVELSLQFDSLGQPEIVTFKAGKLLADIPAAIKKIEPVKALVARRSALKKQLVRMRSSLEEAMQRSDCFTPKELLVLQEHPGLSPLLQNLVFVSDTGKVGFPSEIMSQIAPSEALRVAHPYDLLQSGRWKEIQEQVFNQERVQPFKQVFRELYILTEEEKSKDSVTRFGGHQLRPAQALAILAKRGWVVRHEEGLTKTFHALSITAVITADEVLYSPADIEGVTLEAVEFRDSRTYQLIKLVDVPSILFSEVMRDVDLVVSVAHSTGIDPEATESTVEMRKSVVEQTCKLLSLSNVTFIPRHVKIKGSLAEYTVNLSSGTVHQSAKGELVIIAVRQPQRGRLFLPFVDDDPRTAEIVSKVILLARDSGIKDPTILSQIVGAEV
ncbi:MAG TPA: DUF5724 domain-containing protein, partial [Fimbriimonas sp.]|nr:DUF5724 domain-containing protein [Fimbriimonas sp.]